MDRGARQLGELLGGITLIAEHFDTGPVEVVTSEEPHLSVGKVDVDELSIDKLATAGSPTGCEPYPSVPS